jgi:hypothetical protein
MKARADVVIVRTPRQYRPRPNEQQLRCCAAIDAGARPSSAITPRRSQSKNTARSDFTGSNLIFDQFHRRETQRGLLSEVTFRGKWLERVELRDVEIPRGAPQLSVTLRFPGAVCSTGG